LRQIKRGLKSNGARAPTSQANASRGGDDFLPAPRIGIGSDESFKSIDGRPGEPRRTYRLGFLTEDRILLKSNPDRAESI
jgi:hypothetical protein